MTKGASGTKGSRSYEPVPKGHQRGATPGGVDAEDAFEFLTELGARLRARREQQALSRRDLAKRADVSERFLATVELGDGNISVARLYSLANALGTSLEELFKDLRPESGARRTIALLGIRGAGKSSVGRELARALRVRFVELDERVQAKAGMSLATLFEIHGERHFRKLEREALSELLAECERANEAVVLATGGSIVTDEGTFSLLRHRTATVWLKARPKDHWDRVVAEGDGRPMSGRADAMQELKTLFETRKKLYQRAAHTVDTSARSVDEIVQSLADIARA